MFSSPPGQISYLSSHPSIFPYSLNPRQSLISFLYLCVCVCVCVLSRFGRVPLFVTLWTVACQALLSMGFSRQEYWNGLLCCPPGDLPDPGIEPASLVSCTGRQVFTASVTWEALSISIDLTILDFQHKVNHIVCGVLYLVCFSYCIFLRFIHVVASTSTSFLFMLSCVQLVIPWTVACQTPLSMEFSRQEYQSGLPFHIPSFLFMAK